MKPSMNRFPEPRDEPSIDEQERIEGERGEWRFETERADQYDETQRKEP